MERIELFLIITVALLAIAGIVIGMLALTKKDDTLDPTLKVDGQTVQLKDWLKSNDGMITMNKVIESSKFAEETKNDINTLDTTTVKLNTNYVGKADGQDNMGYQDRNLGFAATPVDSNETVFAEYARLMIEPCSSRSVC